MAESTVKVVFLGDSSKLKRELDGIDDSTSKASTGFGNLGKAIGGAVAVGSVVSLGKGAFDAAIESQKIAKQTEAVIKSTGAAAGITADEIGNMASAMSKKNAVDDEAIQTGQNLLLTFTNIGKSDKIFERTTQAAIDMAAAMGTDVSSAAMQLGKALNDPADGLSKLSRAGVQFTDQQIAQIKAMQDAGDMAGAQAVMLSELERQFGGSAEAQATATDRMGIAFGNLQEAIGARLIPVFERFSAWVVEVGLPAMERLVGWVRDNWPQVQEVIENVMVRVRAVIETVLAAIEAFWRTWGGTITAYLQGLWEAVRQIVEGALRIIQGIINVVMGLIHGDFSQVWEGIRQIFSGAWEAINGIVDYAINGIRTTIEVVMRLIAGVFDATLGAMFDAARRVLFDILGVFVGLGQGIADVVSASGSTLAGWVVDVWSAGGMVLDFVATIPGRIADWLSGLAEILMSPFRQAFDWIRSAWDNSIGAIYDKIKSIGSTIGGVVGSIPGFAGGGYATGLAMVGENGPELVDFGSRGARVYSNSDTTGMLGSARAVSAGGTVINIYVTSNSPNAAADAVARTLMSSQIRVALAGAA